MLRTRWLWVAVIALAVVLVPALLWAERRPPAPAGAQESDPPPPAAKSSEVQYKNEGGDLRPQEQGGDGQPDNQALGPGQTVSWLAAAGVTGAGIAILDGTSGGVLGTFEHAVLAPDASLLYVVRQVGEETHVQALQPETGRVAGEIRLEGRYNLPRIGSLAAGLSPRAHWLVLEHLAWLENGPTLAGSRFAAVDLSLDSPPLLVYLDGQFEFDAVSDDGTRLYLTEYLPTGQGSSEPLFERYRVRLYDLARGVLDPAVIADKTNAEELMIGYRQAAVASPNGRWLYSLYWNPQTESPFIHALNLEDGFAACIDLPAGTTRRVIEPMLWGLVMAPDGRELYVVNGAMGRAHEIDTAELTVRRSVELTVTDAGETLFDRLARLLAPAARAKVGAVNPVALSPDGATLYALAEKGLLAIDPQTLTVRGEYLTDLRLNSLAVGADGAALYAFSLEPSRLLRVDSDTGNVAATLDGQSFWSGILAVNGSPSLIGPAADAADSAHCPVTRPPQPAFVPPPPYDALVPEDGSFWYGGHELWTALTVDGTWRALPDGPGGYSQKTFWWKPGYDPQQEPVPDLVVTGRRLDGPAPAPRVLRATNGFTAEMGSFMLAGIEIPVAGCWQITGRAAGQELSYVVWVGP